MPPAPQEGQELLIKLVSLTMKKSFSACALEFEYLLKNTILRVLLISKYEKEIFVDEGSETDKLRAKISIGKMNNEFQIQFEIVTYSSFDSEQSSQPYATIFYVKFNNCDSKSNVESLWLDKTSKFLEKNQFELIEKYRNHKAFKCNREKSIEFWRECDLIQDCGIGVSDESNCNYDWFRTDFNGDLQKLHLRGELQKSFPYDSLKTGPTRDHTNDDLNEGFAIISHQKTKLGDNKEEPDKKKENKHFSLGALGGITIGNYDGMCQMRFAYMHSPKINLNLTLRWTPYDRNSPSSSFQLNPPKA